MNEFNPARKIADEQMHHVSGGREFTLREAENIEETDHRAMELTEMLKKRSYDELQKFQADYYEAAQRYTRSVLEGRLAPDSILFSDFFETFYGWPQ
ncbi:MAG: hypothetical protein IKS32_12405 [Solobacterium sp.]|nr:hypothetical protein [Solobacterium sp.]